MKILLNLTKGSLLLGGVLVTYVVARSVLDKTLQKAFQKSFNQLFD
jgi:hypothetical protein